MAAHAEHDVSPDQFEPGHPLDEQARRHSLDYFIVQWGVSASLVVGERIALDAEIPLHTNRNFAEFLDAEGQPIAEYESIHHRDETLVGIGDLRLGARYRVRRAPGLHDWSLDLRAGLRLPTGGIQPDPFSLGRAGKEHQHVFFGAGVVRPGLGFQATRVGLAHNVTFWGDAQVALSSNRHGYRPSDVFQGGAVISRLVGLSDWRVRLEPQVYYETIARWSDNDSPNSGRWEALLGAGVTWTGSPDWAFDVLTKRAIYRKVEGGQLDFPLVVQVGVQRRWTAWEPGQ